MAVLDWIDVLLLAAVPGVLAFAGATLLTRRTPVGVLAGTALLLVAGLVPLWLAYAYAYGIAGAVAGAVAAALRGRRAWTLAATAILVVLAEPLLIINVAQVRADEAYSRCAADRAVAAVESSRQQGRGYPANMNEIADGDGEYGDPCYVNSSVNWLYRVSVPGSYTLGYWVDWRVARHVCLHASGTQGWACGFESWGPFKPGEVD